MKGINNEDTFSRVSVLRSIHMLLPTTTSLDYKIWQMNVKTTFLNGNLNESIYIVKPDELKAKAKKKRFASYLNTSMD